MKNRFAAFTFLTWLLLAGLLGACTPAEGSVVQASPTAAATNPSLPTVEPTLAPSATPTSLPSATPPPAPTQAAVDPAPTVQVEQFTEPLPTPPALTAAGRPAESGDLVVLFSMEGNLAPRSDSTLYAFSDHGLLVEGQSQDGVYRAVLPQGTYDLVVLQDSLPPSGYLQKNVRITSGETTTLSLPAAQEADLEVHLHSPAGNPPQNTYRVTISIGEEEVTAANVNRPGTELSQFTLRTDLQYDVTVAYGDLEITAQALAVASEGSSVEMLLPFEEGQLDVFLTRRAEPLLTAANLVVIDPDGRVVIPKTAVEDHFTAYLPAGIEYSVQVQYIDQLEEDTILIEAGGLHPLSIDFYTP